MSTIIGLPSISRLSHKRVSPLVLTLFKTLWYTLVLILLHDYICPWPDVHDVQLYMNPGLETKDHPFQFSLCKQVSYVLTSSSDAALATWQCVIYKEATITMQPYNTTQFTKSTKFHNFHFQNVHYHHYYPHDNVYNWFMLTLLWVQAVCRSDTPFQGQDDQCGHRDHYKQTWFSESSNYGNNDDGDDYEKDHGQENERRWWYW